VEVQHIKLHELATSKSSKAINLVLIGSSLIVAGCQRNPASTTKKDTSSGSWTGSYAGGGHYYRTRSAGRTVFIPVPVGGGAASRPAGGVAFSTRGGFGASAAAHAGS
jgi:hypothetical protein